MQDVTMSSTPRHGHLRLTIVASSLGIGGVEGQLLNLASRLDPQRISVQVVALKPDGLLDGEAVRRGVRLWTPRPGSGRIVVVRQVRERLIANDVDCVLAANPYATIMAVVASRFLARCIPIVSAFHSVPSGIKPGLRSVAQMYLYGLALRACSSMVYVGERQRAEWQARGFAEGVDSVIIHNGIDVDAYRMPSDPDIRGRLGWKPDDFVVGLCAGFRTEKRIDDLIESARALSQIGVPIRLLFVGDGVLRADMEQRCAQALQPGSYHFAGWQRDVASYMHACDVMALVSSAEAFSIAVLEGMACGKALLLTAVGGAADQIEHGIHGYIVPVGQPAAIAENLRRIHDDRLAVSMGRAGQERVAQAFPIDAMVARYADTVVDVVARDRRQANRR